MLSHTSQYTFLLGPPDMYRSVYDTTDNKKRLHMARCSLVPGHQWSLRGLVLNHGDTCEVRKVHNIFYPINTHGPREVGSLADRYFDYCWWFNFSRDDEMLTLDNLVCLESLAISMAKSISNDFFWNTQILQCRWRDIPTEIFQLHEKNWCVKKILCNYIYIIILHVYIINYTCIHNYLACIHEYLPVYIIMYTCIHNYVYM